VAQKGAGQFTDRFGIRGEALFALVDRIEPVRQDPERRCQIGAERIGALCLTGDAIFTQREICRVIIDGGGDCFFTVKDNQPTLKSDIALAFGPFSPLCGVGAAA